MQLVKQGSIRTILETSFMNLKDDGVRGSKNDKGDFTYDELIEIAEMLKE